MFKRGIDIVVAFTLTMLMFFAFFIIVESDLIIGMEKAWFLFWLFLSFPFNFPLEFHPTTNLTVGFLVVFMFFLLVRPRSMRLLALTLWFVGWIFHGAISTGGA